MSIYRASFTTRCRQCAIMIWRSGLDAHGFRMTASAVIALDEDGKYDRHIAATGNPTSIPEDINEPCMVHRAILDRSGVQEKESTL